MTNTAQQNEPESPRERVIREDKQRRVGQIGYIIYPDELQRFVKLIRKYNLVGWFPLFDVIQSRPYNEQAISEQVLEKIAESELTFRTIIREVHSSNRWENSLKEIELLAKEALDDIAELRQQQERAGVRK